MSMQDPSELQGVDQAIRINELKEQAAAVSGGWMTAMESEDAPPEAIEQFWRNVVAIEGRPLLTDRERLARAGVDLPPPSKISDDDLADKLVELLSRLADMRVYVYNTNHLSDRAFYERLWLDVLDEEHPEIPPGPNAAWLVDILGGGSEADCLLYLKYYADEESRRLWKRDWPDDEIPDHEDPPFDRDRRLPKPPMDV